MEEQHGQKKQVIVSRPSQLNAYFVKLHKEIKTPPPDLVPKDTSMDIEHDVIAQPNAP